MKAFRGSKDGYLFFLETGILWGFKKPLMFIPLNRIAATSFTNILQRTFNLSVEVFAGEGDATEEVEFSMIDQEDYGGIDEYIKNKRLQDRSMAEQRKAKLELAENRAAAKKNGEEAGEGEAPGGDISELAKAQVDLEQALQDEEDEDEEDYDPGSDADSDGSGESDEDDSDDDEDDEDDEGEDGEEGEEGEDAEGEAEASEDDDEDVKPEPEIVKPEPKAKPAPKVKAEPKAKPAPAPAPKPVQEPVVKSGWAALRSVPRAPAPAESMDLDDEKFDVV